MEQNNVAHFLWLTVYIQQCTDAKKISRKNGNKNRSFQLLRNHHKQNYMPYLWL